ncbi:MAG TPA: sigma-70 family RNA polymerase sigma factor [Tepidisphaeraceae bacterium]|nr:sigma-70 family RNA polymerase sigma factor [Tepidisphaeraceae bacterium]
MQLSLTQIEAAAVDGPADELLVRRLRDGDAAAGDLLVQRYHQHLLRYLQRLAGDSHVAEELHQATWLSALEHLESFVPSSAGGGFKSWLFRIATNKAHDTWRSRNREKAAKDNLAFLRNEEAADASNFPEGQEQKEKLQKAIDQLPENQRVVLLLRYYSQMKFVDIAKVLGCPLNTALGRMHKAMEKLKELMEG